MPQNLVAFVIVAARLQSLDFVKNYVAKVRIFPELAKLFSSYFASLKQVFHSTVGFPLSHFPTFDIYIFRFLQAETLILYIL